MADDVFADQFSMNLGPFGCALNFTLSSAMPAAPGGATQGQPVATVRMSLEHLKLMTFLIRRQLIEYERQAGVRIPIGVDVLNQLRVGREDWTEFWGE
jgi:hypothetical protein